VQSGNWAEVKGEEGNNSSLYLSWEGGKKKKIKAEGRKDLKREGNYEDEK
jgi:hypothetical protein